MTQESRQDERITLGLTRTTRKDSSTMKVVAIITVIYLPGTFVAVRECPKLSCHWLIQPDFIQHRLHECLGRRPYGRSSESNSAPSIVICRNYSFSDADHTLHILFLESKPAFTGGIGQWHVSIMFMIGTALVLESRCCAELLRLFLYYTTRSSQLKRFDDFDSFLNYIGGMR